MIIKQINKKNAYVCVKVKEKIKYRKSMWQKKKD